MPLDDEAERAACLAAVDARLEPAREEAAQLAVWVEGEVAWLVMPGLAEAIALQRAHLPLLAAAVARLSEDWS